MNPKKENIGNFSWKGDHLSFEMFKDNPELKDTLRCEEVRLSTFRNWPLKFMNPEDLARNGFYYLGRGDEVRCAFCKVEIMRWEEGDDPAKDHQRWAPHCPFLRYSARCGNVPIAPAVAVGREERRGPTQEPAHPEYASQAARLRTFEDWPRGMRQRPEELAEAGFFYVGQSDKTTCFYCGGGLRDWESDDVPWEEHARCFDRCPFVRARVLSQTCELEENKNYTQKFNTEIPESKMSRFRYIVFLLISNTLSDIYSELKQTIVSQGVSFGNSILISMYSVIFRLMALWSRSRSVTQEDWRGVSYAFRSLVLSSVTKGNQIVNRVLHWSLIKRILSLLRVFFMAFF